MLLSEIAEELVRLSNAFELKVGGKYSDMEAVEAMIPSLRQDAIIYKYNGSKTRAASKKIDAAWLQKFEIDIVPSQQNPILDYLVFTSPLFVNVSPTVGGDVYVGDKATGTRFTRAQSRDEISTLKDRGLLSVGLGNVVYTQAGTEFEVFGNPFLKKIYVEGIVANPLDVSTFNPETQAYPISDELFSIMQDLWVSKIKVTLGQAVSNIDDDTDTQSKRIIKSNLG